MQDSGLNRFREFPVRICIFFLIFVSMATAPVLRAQTIHVDITPSHSTNTIQQILSAGWQTVTYRQNTELHVEAWHWNPQGTWSDPAGKGYFTGSATPGAEMIRHSYGYPLPHRGVTRDDGTDTEGYSRLTDGDEDSYWKCLSSIILSPLKSN